LFRFVPQGLKTRIQLFSSIHTNQFSLNTASMCKFSFRVWICKVRTSSWLLHCKCHFLIYHWPVCVFSLNQKEWNRLPNLKLIVISSDPSCKDGNAWFTTVPLKALFDTVWIMYQWYNFRLIIFIRGFSTKETCAFLL